MTAFIDGQPVTLTGTVTSLQPQITEVSRRDWAVAQFAVGDDVLVLHVFPGVWPKARQHLADGATATVRGRIDLHTGELRLIAHTVTAIGALR